MSAAASRRNGKPASCEPCRKGKIRCDHQRPICGRCQHRGISPRCFYHPAPLTRPRAERGHEPHESPQAALRTPALSIGRSPLEHTGNAGEAIQAAVNAARSQDVPFVEFHGGHYTLSHIDATREITSDLRHFVLIRQLIEEYYIHSQAALVPGPIMIRAVENLSKTYSALIDSSGEISSSRLQELSEKVLGANNVSIKITTNLPWEAFVDMHTKENLRLEVIGLIYATAARAFIFGLARGEERQDGFVQALFRSSTACYEIARERSYEVNDCVLWLSFELLRLTTSARGDTHESVWNRTGSVSNCLLAMGLNREAVVTNNAPFWLIECRRKTWACIHQFDKFVATLFDRPPRILTRYADCQMPLDLDDNELLGNQFQLEHARSNLRPDGWSAEGRLCSATWARMRYLCGIFREEILEYPFRSPNPENIAQLKIVADRLENMWKALPEHLHYHPNVWNLGISASACLMLGICHLLYLQSNFHIHRMLEKNDAGYKGTFLAIAADIVATVVHMGNVRDRAVFLRHDNSYVMLCYGLPAAGVLIQAISRNGVHSLPNGLSRSKLIRNLSVFVSYLENICTPGEANYDVCVQAASAFTRTLDEILDQPMPQALPTPGPQTPASSNNIASERLRAVSPARSIPFGPELMPSAELDLNADGWDSFDLDAWVRSIDFNGVSLF